MISTLKRCGRNEERRVIEEIKKIEGRMVKKLDQKIPPAGFESVGRFWGASRGLLTYQICQEMEHYYKLVWPIKLLRNWYRAHLRKFGIKWKWKGQGFTALDGVLLINQLMILRY